MRRKTLPPDEDQCPYNDQEMTISSFIFIPPLSFPSRNNLILLLPICFIFFVTQLTTLLKR